MKLQLPRPGGKVTLLQVFNRGLPCGWLGTSTHGFWFHYSSGANRQPWVSLTMPPSQNHYQQRTLFSAFQQHLPARKGCEWLQQQLPDTSLDELQLLSLAGTNVLGSLSFANPDAPLVQPRAWASTAQLLQLDVTDLQILGSPLLSGLCSMSRCQFLSGTQARNATPHLLVHLPEHAKQIHTLHNELLEAKTGADPNSRLNALKWLHSSQFGKILWFQERPDFEPFRQQRLGLDLFQTLMNISNLEYAELQQNTKRFRQVCHEVIQTFCKNAQQEIKLFDALFELVLQGKIQPFVLYQQPTGHNTGTIPTVLGVDYLANGG